MSMPVPAFFAKLSVLRWERKTPSVLDTEGVFLFRLGR
jgi:hypothetical protein